MAAPTEVDLHPVSPPGMIFTDRGQAATAMVCGQLLNLATTTPSSGHEKVWELAPASTVEPDGVCLIDTPAGKSVSVGLLCEIDGYSGLTPGTAYYASATVAGGIDSTVVTNAAIRMKAVSATRMRFAFV